jgi:hypothetical protein
MSGSQFSYYNATAYSTLGPLGTPLTTFPKYLTPTDNRPYGFYRGVQSQSSSVGTRYKLSPLRDLMIDLRFQYFPIGWFKPNPDLQREQNNDWLVWLNVGYIYYLQ